MIKNILFISMLFVNFLNASGQPVQYWRLIDHYSRKPINFYWDWHEGPDYKVPTGVSKEIIYHQYINSPDSALEKVTWFNRQGLPQIEQHYAAPTNEGLVFIDSFFYNSDNLLVRTTRHYTGAMQHPETTVIGYDSLHREISRLDHIWTTDSTETEYFPDFTMKKTYFLNGVVSKTKLQYYSHGREDSMQIFNWNSTFRYQKNYLYDTVQLKKETYVTALPDGKLLDSRYEYNQDGTVKVYLSTWYNNYNWNRTKKFDVESHISYNSDKSVKECLYFLDNKIAFKKKHYYEYY